MTEEEEEVRHLRRRLYQSLCRPVVRFLLSLQDNTLARHALYQRPQPRHQAASSLKVIFNLRARRVREATECQHLARSSTDVGDSFCRPKGSDCAASTRQRKSFPCTTRRRARAYCTKPVSTRHEGLLNAVFPKNSGRVPAGWARASNLPAQVRCLFRQIPREPLSCS